MASKRESFLQWPLLGSETSHGLLTIDHQKFNKVSLIFWLNLDRSLQRAYKALLTPRVSDSQGEEVLNGPQLHVVKPYLRCTCDQDLQLVCAAARQCLVKFPVLQILHHLTERSSCCEKPI